MIYIVCLHDVYHLLAWNVSFVYYDVNHCSYDMYHLFV